MSDELKPLLWDLAEGVFGLLKAFLSGFIPMGTPLAVVISWQINQSILWGSVHGFCSWFYIVYYVLGYGR